MFTLKSLSIFPTYITHFSPCFFIVFTPHFGQELKEEGLLSEGAELPVEEEEVVSDSPEPKARNKNIPTSRTDKNDLRICLFLVVKFRFHYKNT